MMVRPSKFSGLRQSMSYKRDPRLEKIETTVQLILIGGVLLVLLYGIVAQ